MKFKLFRIPFTNKDLWINTNKKPVAKVDPYKRDSKGKFVGVNKNIKLKHYLKQDLMEIYINNILVKTIKCTYKQYKEYKYVYGKDCISYIA